ncbi:MAG TPA: iron-sulfur cluster-binding protein [Firmicutes bacterium]|nr:iron-sulfur cluster-binding protein [Bacillota bacterium]
MIDGIYVSYGHKPVEMVQELLQHLNLARSIAPGARIGLKPNLVVARPAWEGATTSPQLVEGVIQYLQDHGHKNIVVLEGSWIGDSTRRAFQVCGYTELAERYGVELVDLQKDSFHPRKVMELELLVCDELSRVDFLINLPVLKGHCQTKITCALKNLKGCIPNQEKRRFHTLGLHKPIAYLNKAVPTDLVIVDGLMGDLDFEEGGNPVQMDRVLVGSDPVLVDSYVAHLLGYDPEEIGYLPLAAELGVGRLFGPDTEVVVLRGAHATQRMQPTRKVARLARLVQENQACSACFGSLIHALARLDERGLLPSVPRPLSIGQGFRGKTGQGLGIGSCTRGLGDYAPGCPPSAKAILDFLAERLS